VAGDLEDNWLFSHEVALLERFCEIQLCAEFLGLHGLTLCLCVLGAVAHCD
jgi:hypothetical protein